MNYLIACSVTGLLISGGLVWFLRNGDTAHWRSGMVGAMAIMTASLYLLADGVGLHGWVGAIVKGMFLTAAIIAWISEVVLYRRERREVANGRA